MYRDCRVAYGGNGSALFAERLRQVLVDSATAERPRREMVRVSKAVVDLPSWVNPLLSQHNSDDETRQVATLIQTLAQTSQKNVVYSIYRERVDGSSRYICIVHVLQDQTFQKFQKNKPPGCMNLFRGFSFELIGGGGATAAAASDGDTNKTAAAPAAATSMDIDANDGESGTAEETLMLKMKFLPYMVRITRILLLIFFVGFVSEFVV